MRRRAQGFTILEVLVAVVLVAVTLLASLRLVVAVMGIIGRNPAAYANPSEERTARARIEAAAWAQAQLELVKQIGFEPFCPPGTESCEFWSPQTCAGSTSEFPFQDVGPGPPQGFWATRLEFTWAPNSPVLDGEQQLRLVRLDVFREQEDCTSPEAPFLTLFTALRRQ